MTIFVMIAFLLIVLTILFLLCRRRKRGRLLYAVLTALFLFQFGQYQTRRGVLKSYADYEEIYAETYAGEIRFALNGKQTSMVVGVDENGVQNYMMVYQTKDGKWRRTLDDYGKRVLTHIDGIMVEEEKRLFGDDRYLIVTCIGEKNFAIECQGRVESVEINRPTLKGMTYYVYAEPDENGLYTIVINGEKAEFKL